MSFLNYLEMQPIEGYDDATPKNEFDDVFDLSRDTPSEELVAKLGAMVLDVQMDALNDKGT